MLGIEAGYHSKTTKWFTSSAESPPWSTDEVARSSLLYYFTEHPKNKSTDFNIGTLTKKANY